MLWAWVAVACTREAQPLPEATDDAVIEAFVSFEDADALTVAVETLSDSLAEFDLTAQKTADRTFAPSPLTEADISAVDHPDTSVDRAVPIAVVGLSAFQPSDHGQIQVLVDQTPVEPYSPEYYERSFVEGEGCWIEQECEVLRTHNDLIKENLLMEVPYTFNKDFRWLQMEGGLALVARSWMPDSAFGDGGDVLQAYTVEVWLPADGGTTHMVALWSETVLHAIDVSDETMAAVTAGGMDDNLAAADAWLETHAD